MSGKIDNKYDAEAIKIKKDKDYLDSMSLKSDDSLQLRKLFDDIEYAVFGIFLPSQESKKLDMAKGGEDIPELETEEQAEQRQHGEGLKIMTPNQLITRLPILLAQKQAGNNSQKLNNEIRQIVYSLYRSINLSKTIYNHL